MQVLLDLPLALICAVGRLERFVIARPRANFIWT